MDTSATNESVAESELSSVNVTTESDTIDMPSLEVLNDTPNIDNTSTEENAICEVSDSNLKPTEDDELKAVDDELKAVDDELKAVDDELRGEETLVIEPITIVQSSAVESVVNIPEVENELETEIKSESALEVEDAVALLTETNESVDKEVQPSLEHQIATMDEVPVVDQTNEQEEMVVSYVDEGNENESYIAVEDSTVSSVNGEAQAETVISIEDDVVQSEVMELDNSMEVNVSDVQDNDQVEILQENIACEEEVVVEQSEGIEEVIEEDEKSSQCELNIPCHVMGRNVDNPLVDPVKNGRVLLKPRLGVKIPYRNLTSQIVSKQEIADEIMERSRRLQSSADPPAGGDFFFTKRLTQRLAKKLTTKDSPGKASSSKRNNEKLETIENVTATILSEPSPIKPNEVEIPNKLANNSDLIALLEGDDDDWTPESDKAVEKPVPTPKKPSPEWEREIALKQLSELPKSLKNIAEKIENGTKSTPKKTNKESSKDSKKSVPTEDLNVVPSKKSVPAEDLNIVPRFSSSSVVKTYTRKRKPSEDIQAVLSAQALKKSNVEQKSSAPVTLPVAASPASDQVSKAPATTVKSQVAATPPSASKSVKREIAESDKKDTKVKKELVKETKKPVNSVKKSTDKGKEKPIPEVAIKSPETPKGSISPNTYISKSSRVVKRKKIWDPDEVTSTIKSPPFKSPKLIDSSKNHVEKVQKSPEKKVKSNDNVKVVNAENVLTPANKPEKKISVIPKLIGKKSLKKRGGKRLTEVDKLLMDEGAVNLLYSVKNTDDIPQVGKGKKNSMISLDKMHRELLNKTNEIKNDLQLNSTKDSPISLRKKDGNLKIPTKDITSPILQRKISKDSTTGSVHSPPASPGFEYSDRVDGSRIIRRHSNSSFSSENSDEENYTDKPPKQKSGSIKKKQKNQDKQTLPVKDKGSSIGVDKKILNQEMSKNFNKSVVDDPKYSEYKFFTVRKFENLVQLILSPNSSNSQSSLSLELLKELMEVLELLAKDNGCRIVLVSSSGSSFCQGLDYKELFAEDAESRTKVAVKYSTAVKDFLVALAKFPKLLVAGVHGATIGLGVTMLPLFDMVLASDTATFSTPYTRLGCPAEGGMLLTLPHIMHNSLASELFFASRKLTAAEGLRQGLVTRTLWPDKFQEELISTLKVISNQSLQSMQAIKKQLRYQLLLGVEAALTAESPILVEHWTSKECQDNFRNYSLEIK